MRKKLYQVQPPEDFISPEETLLDSSSNLSSVEIPIGKGVVRLFVGAIALVLVIFLIQAFRLQIIEGKASALRADQSLFLQYPVPSLRGMIFDRKGKPIVENIPVFDLVVVRSEVTDPEILKQIPDVAVYALKKNISKDEAIRLQTEQTPGFYVATYARREYPYGPGFAQVAGYTSQTTSDELSNDARLQVNERIGRSGLEAQYDDLLRGPPYGIVLDPETIRTQSPKAGQSLATNLDVDIQIELYRALDQVFRSSGVQRGAAIVQDVHTGAVLAMVSMPTFDPNDLNEQVFANRNHPLFNRVISGLYSPGSTIKPLFALVGLKEGAITTATKIFAEGFIQVQSDVDPSQYFTFRDWKVHGWTDVYKSIADSVDVFYYALGGGYPPIRGVGIDVLEKYLRLAMADSVLGVDLPGEARGFVPSKKWKKETKNDSWYVGDTYNVSIGQGDLSVTPLWLNTYIGAIANGGKLMQPQVAQQKPVVLGTLPFDAETLSIVQKGMRQTITDGTGQLLKDLPKPVAAKTGTAQVSGRGLNSLFVVYGPYENPEIVMTILVENIPQSQSLAMQVAKNFLSWYFTR